MDLPFHPYAPDLGPFAPNSTDYAINVIPIENGFGPFPSAVELSAALGSEVKGAWQVRTTAGTYLYFAATQTAIKKMSSTYTWTDVSRLVGGAYTGPDSGGLWTAALFGDLLHLSNWNDNLQVIDITVAVNFADCAGSPPRGKYIAVVGDFLFLAGLSVGATRYQRDWQHSAINDSVDWVIDGTPGASDRQSNAAGGDITGILPRVNSGARLFQRNAKRAINFTPGGATAFQQIDIDPSRGVFAPFSIVDIGGDDYMYVHEQGVFRGDSHQPVGLGIYNQYLLDTVDYTAIERIQGIFDPRSLRVWWRAQDSNDRYFLFGYDIARQAFMQSDEEVVLLVQTVTVGATIDSILGLVDSFVGVLVDSPIFAGGRVQLGGFKANQKLSSYQGTPAAAVIDISTTELNPDGGAALLAVKLKGDVPTWTIEVGTCDRNDDIPTFSLPIAADDNGFAPTMHDANYHRLRLRIPAGTDWSHIHALVPRFKPSRRISI